MNVDARAAVLGVARSMLWVREIGANRGQAVEAILRSVHLAAGAPWCAAFVNHVGQSVCDGAWPLPMVGGCATLGEAAALGRIMRIVPEPGAIFLLWSGTHRRFNHTGFVTHPRKPLEWGTVEGNTSPDGSPEGTGVFERARTFKPEDRFIHWWVEPPKGET